MLEALKAAIPQPETMKPDAYERTLKARAFDVARYLLPLATNTSLGQIVNARTLENQMSRLLSSPFAESLARRKAPHRCRRAGMERSADPPSVLCEEIRSRRRQPAVHALAESLLRPVKTAPTLVKYATPND